MQQVDIRMRLRRTLWPRSRCRMITMVRLPRSTLTKNMMGLGNTMRLRLPDLCQVQQGSGSRELHEIRRMMQTNASLMLVEDTPRYQHPESRIGIYSMINIGTFFDYVRHGKRMLAPRALVPDRQRLLEAQCRQMVAEYAPRRRVPGYIDSSFNCDSAAN